MESSAGGTGSCPPDEKPQGLQYISRIPLPQMGI